MSKLVINKLKEETIFWKNMTINKINEFDETKLEAEKNLEKLNEMLENPQITQQRKDELTRIRNEFLALIIECVFNKYHLKQAIEMLKKKYK